VIDTLKLPAIRVCLVQCAVTTSGTAESADFRPLASDQGTVTLEKPFVKSPDLSLVSVPAFWPIVMAARLIEAGAELYAKNLSFVEEEIRIHGDLRPALATSNQVRLDPCATTESRAEFPPSSMRPMPATRR
jgi:hypothetical protein